MSVKDRIAQQEAEKDAAARKAEVDTLTTSFRASIEEVKQEHAESIDRLTAAQIKTKELVEEISRRSGRASEKKLDNVVEKLAQQQNTIDELVKTVETFGESLASSEVVTLGDGETVRRSDLDAASIARRLEEQIRELSTNSDKLADQVKAKSQATLDTDVVVEMLTNKFAEAFDQAIQEQAAETAAKIDAISRRLTEAETAPQGRAARRLEEATAAITASADRVERAEKKMSWNGVGQIMMSLVPLAVVALAAGLVVDLGAQVYGVSPLFAWIWAGFEAASGWGKAPWAIAGLAGAAGLTGLVVWGGKWLYYVYKGWSSL